MPVTRGVHAQRDVQVLLHGLDELALLLFVVTRVRLEFGENLPLLGQREQAWYFPAGEQTVHALQERHRDDLALVEHEDDVLVLLLCEFGEQLHEVFVELGHVIVFVHVQVEFVLLQDFLDNLEQHGLARAAETHQHYMAQRLV